MEDPRPALSPTALPKVERPVRRTAGFTRVGMDPAAFKRALLDHVLYSCARELREATPADLYQALAHAVRDRLVHRWLATQRTYEERDVKRAVLPVLGVPDRPQPGPVPAEPGPVRDGRGASPASAASTWIASSTRRAIPGLGNGGLGRLAACFMDSLATLALPAVGYGIRYDFGIFEQRIEDGHQVELHDNWLQSGNPWELPRLEDAQIVPPGRAHRDPPRPRRPAAGRLAAARARSWACPTTPSSSATRPTR